MGACIDLHSVISLPLFYFFELMAVKNGWPVGYVLFPAGMILLFSATGEITMLRAHAIPRNGERS